MNDPWTWVLALVIVGTAGWLAWRFRWLVLALAVVLLTLWWLAGNVSPDVLGETARTWHSSGQGWSQ